ncbi:MAG: DUF3891 family protein [Acidobacteria bacterium]|nr:DUF3891 family protein [Acidobacteriota bacterium]
MVLNPLPAPSRAQRNRHLSCAWQAVENRQTEAARQWWLIAQIDHAVLAGDLAARLEFPAIPILSEEVIGAISAHDAGWTQLDVLDDHGSDSVAKLRPPRSFLEILPQQFLIAWTSSIQAAERIGPVGGIIVSEHFRRLGQARLATQRDTPEDVLRLEQFVWGESGRQTRLRTQVHSSRSELEHLTDILQFCDLVSLYLCCGAADPAEFPQRFQGTRIRVRCEGDMFLFTPPVFGRGVALGVSARRYPGEKRSASLPFLIA